jgi:hypothetical protein
MLVGLDCHILEAAGARAALPDLPIYQDCLFHFTLNDYLA